MLRAWLVALVLTVLLVLLQKLDGAGPQGLTGAGGSNVHKINAGSVLAPVCGLSTLISLRTVLERLQHNLGDYLRLNVSHATAQAVVGLSAAEKAFHGVQGEASYP